jgi:flagellum-specific ATP synthase
MNGWAERIRAIFPFGLEGTVLRAAGLAVAVADFPAPVGALAEIDRPGQDPLLAEVVGFRDRLTLLLPYGETSGLRRAERVRLRKTAWQLQVGEGLLGRVIDPLGRPLDGRPLAGLTGRVLIQADPPPSCSRPRITQPLATGVRAIDGLLTCGRGQRLGIFSGSGIGKSVLLGMMARYTDASRVVLALIGERGREVREFLERDLGPAGLAKSVVVVATSDQPAILRVRAAFVATRLAEYFRDQGHDVLLLVDSLTRFALAQREIALAAGELPGSRGYPPSVFALLPRLVERAGTSMTGTITAFYSVLVEADDPHEPIADCLRGLLDGHIWLSRKLASAGHYPAIDVLESLSRLMPEVTSPEHREAAVTVRRLLAAYREHEDLITVGAYRKGADKWVDCAIELREAIDKYLRQPVEQPATFDEARQGLLSLGRRAVERLGTTPAGTRPQEPRQSGTAAESTTS